MPALGRLVVPLLLALSVASPAVARTAAIETAIALKDRSQSSIEQAAREALESCVRGAVAMGLSQIRVNQALVLTNMVIVQILATDELLDREEEEETPDPGPGAGLAPRELL